MILAYLGEAEGRYELQVEGHAGYHPGNDIVCAGVSALVCALVGGLENMEGHVEELESNTASGSAMVRCRGDEMAGGLFLMAEVGLRQIEAAHGAHIKFFASLAQLEKDRAMVGI